jgi:hypothetical protein
MAWQQFTEHRPLVRYTVSCLFTALRELHQDIILLIIHSTTGLIDVKVYPPGFAHVEQGRPRVAAGSTTPSPTGRMSSFRGRFVCPRQEIRRRGCENERECYLKPEMLSKHSKLVAL